MRILFISLLLTATAYLPAQKVDKTYLLADTTRYSDARGYGYDFVPNPTKSNKGPFFYSVKVPDGNYLVTVTIGSKKQVGVTTVRAENRRLFVERLVTKKRQFEERSFVVNKRTPRISDKEFVKIKEREKDYMTWDDRLTLEFNGDTPLCQSIRIQSAPDSIITVYLCGNSTVVDQSREPWASWGQMIPRFFSEHIAFANYAESGETAGSFMDRGRLRQAISKMKVDDYVFIEFGHNDKKEVGAGKGAYYSFMTNLKTMIDEVRSKNAHPVLVTPTSRRQFDDNGKINDTHGEYDDAVRWLAAKENVPLIDLTKMTAVLYETLGLENSKKAFVHYPANTFPNQRKALADNTHFSTYGAYEVAQCILRGIIDNKIPLEKYILPEYKNFNPAKSDDFNTFHWDLAPLYKIEKPDEN
jgi:Lysophospholipase L1 and related esterases